MHLFLNLRLTRNCIVIYKNNSLSNRIAGQCSRAFLHNTKQKMRVIDRSKR